VNSEINKSQGNKLATLFNLLRKYLTKIIDRFKRLKKQVGIGNEKEPASFELSKLLVESQLALDNLPPASRKIFEIRAIEDEPYFVNRERELELLGKMYEDWEKDRFVTCAIIGEKGSGITSLLNAFLDQVSDVPILRHELHEKIYTAEQYYDFINSMLKTKGINSNSKLIDKINRSKDSQIIVIENLQHMFLKKIGGFTGIKMLFELISHTSDKVLWIGTFTPISWSYLDKTVYISNYFSVEIQVENFLEETIQKMMMKRNEYGGYQITFMPTEDTQKSKLFEKLDETEKQNYLHNQFFQTLTEQSNGNITLAQFYWLRAVQEVDGKQIIMEPIDRLDDSFIEHLPQDALFTLQALLVHDGLTLEDFALAMYEPESVCRNKLVPMLEKGLLIRPNQKYNVNPGIYKHVHADLSSKNFIH
jgi:hypothetical protein